MTWRKVGQIFRPNAQYDWVITHGMLPIAEHISGDFFRIYFSGRDRLNRSHVGSLDLDITRPYQILHLSPEPVLSLGALGSFDDNGVSPTFIVNNDGEKFLYYFGWNKGSSVRAAEVSGLAIYDHKVQRFKRYSRAPVIDRTNMEPFQILVISCILIEGGVWRMWYDSADEWQTPDLPKYNIKYAESTDGINWDRRGIVSVDYKFPLESRVSRASILREGETYKMWHCYAIGEQGYRMGYAESADGYKFERQSDALTIQRSESGWDSEMVCYPYVFVHNGQKFMLYCGNGYGRTGFGLAVEE
jgi:hypothetical protein